MDNPETLTILGTQDTGVRQTKHKNTTQQRSYFPYDGQTGTRSSKNSGKDNKFEYDFLIICIIEPCKNQGIIL